MNIGNILFVNHSCAYMFIEDKAPFCSKENMNIKIINII